MPDEARVRRIVVVGPSVLLVLTVLIGVVTNVLTGGRFSWWLTVSLLGLVGLAAVLQTTLSRLDARTAARDGFEPSTDRDPVLTAGLRLADAVWLQDDAALDQLVRRPLARYGQDDSDQQLHIQWAEWAPSGPGPDRFDELDALLRHRRLVILGAPGAGKSIMAMRITQLLAARAVSQAEHATAFPVRANLVDVPRLFDQGVPRDLPMAARRLDDWLVRKVVQAGVPRTQARQLVAAGRIIAVLDGLDEVDSVATGPRQAMDIVEVLNYPHPGPLGRRSVVLTCQTSRYVELVRGAGDTPRERTWLDDAQAVEILPLRPATVIAEVERRFAGALEPWRAVLERLRQDSPDDRLVAAMRSPLHLSLLIDLQLTHTTAVPDTSEQVEDAIFGRYIEMVAKRDGRYTSAQVVRWLTVIAHHLESREHRRDAGDSFNVTDLRRAVLPRFVRVVTVLLGGMLALLLGGRVVLSLVPPDFHGTEGFYRMVGTFVGAAAILSIFGNIYAPRLGLRLLRHRHTWIRLARAVVERSFAGAAIGAFGGLVFGLLRHSSHLSVAVGYTAFGYAGAGAVLGLVRGVDLSPPARSRREFVAQGLVCVIAMLVLSAAVGALVFAFLGTGLVPIGVCLGLLAGFVVVGATIWPTYLVACLIHTISRRLLLPARPATFLDWAHTAGLIRPTGNDDQIRHHALRDWLLTR
jgi:hypothetical protein